MARERGEHHERSTRKMPILQRRRLFPSLAGRDGELPRL